MKIRNNYKGKNTKLGMIERGKRGNFTKRGQITIFVIIAIVIVAIVLVIFLFPNIRTRVLPGEFTPNSYLKSCIEQEIKKTIEILNKQGGYLRPEGFLVYNDTKIKYLCYSSEYYKTCVVQQPMIKNHYEQELEREINPIARQCISNLKTEYENRGYSTSVGRADFKIEIIPDKIKAELLGTFSVSKGESSQSFDGFNIEIRSEMYDLLFITQSIIDYESTYGDSETTLYLQYYPNLKIEKTKLSDGSKIYRVSDVETEEKFTFASRSLAWPPGYGLE